jgi:hypothetical protein
MPDESHFTLLADVDRLISRIRDDEVQLLSIEQKCEDSLRSLWKKFRCGTRNRDLLELNPCITIFQRELLNVGNRTKLPSLAKTLIE